ADYREFPDEGRPSSRSPPPSPALEPSKPPCDACPRWFHARLTYRSTRPQPWRRQIFFLHYAEPDTRPGREVHAPARLRGGDEDKAPVLFAGGRARPTRRPGSRSKSSPQNGLRP